MNMKKLELVDTITALVCYILDWKWSDAEGGLVDADGVYIGWEDFGSIPINLGDIVQINFWGDGTIELQEKNCESICIYDYDTDIMEKVIDALLAVENSK